jgi:hypothetical protein
MTRSDDFKRITIVSINGVLERVPHAINSLVLSERQLPGAHCLLIAPALPDKCPEFIHHVPIGQLGYVEYSLFVLYCLRAFVKTEFALIVQDDGWILNGANWRQEYFDYDVVGAPVHLARVYGPAGPQFMSGFTWTQAPSHLKRDIILNGGFALRSRRILEAPAHLGLSVIVPPVAALIGPPYSMRFPNEQPLEDVQLCTFMRIQLESVGMKFAPLDVARMFSFEHLAPNLHDNLKLDDVFGHHSKLRRLTSIQPPTISYSISEQEMRAVYGEPRIVDLLVRYGYRVTFKGA